MIIIAVELCIHPFFSVSGTLYTLCTPLSCFKCPNTSSPETLNNAFLHPLPIAVSGVNLTSSHLQPYSLQYASYICIRSSANKLDSDPPVACLISKVQLQKSASFLGIKVSMMLSSISSISSRNYALSSAATSFSSSSCIISSQSFNP